MDLPRCLECLSMNISGRFPDTIEEPISKASCDLLRLQETGLKTCPTLQTRQKSGRVHGRSARPAVLLCAALQYLRRKQPFKSSVVPSPEPYSRPSPRSSPLGPRRPFLVRLRFHFRKPSGTDRMPLSKRQIAHEEALALSRPVVRKGERGERVTPRLTRRLLTVSPLVTLKVPDSLFVV